VYPFIVFIPIEPFNVVVLSLSFGLILTQHDFLKASLESIKVC